MHFAFGLTTKVYYLSCNQLKKVLLFVCVQPEGKVVTARIQTNVFDKVGRVHCVPRIVFN